MIEVTEEEYEKVRNGALDDLGNIATKDLFYALLNRSDLKYNSIDKEPDTLKGVARLTYELVVSDKVKAIIYVESKE